MKQTELEARLIYSVIVAGKSAKFAEKALRQLNSHSRGQPPFEMVRRLIAESYLERALQMARTGNYSKIAKCLRQIVETAIDLRTCEPNELEAIHGIGPKTARFFIIWTRPGARYAALDVHVLRWMKARGYDAPPATPQNSKRYAELEQAFLKEADERGMSPRELDDRIWRDGSKYED